MILTTKREIQVSEYLRAHRKRLRPVVEVRCRGDGRLLAAVYPLRDEFWVWYLGERYSPKQWQGKHSGPPADVGCSGDWPRLRWV